jgi:acid phosphatase family membrane protein YuiD
VTHDAVNDQLARNCRLTLAAVVAVAFFTIRPCIAEDTDGPFEIDHRMNNTDRGLWSRKLQLGLQAGLVLGVVGAALYEGNEDRFGKTAWQAVDSMLLTAGATQVSKRVFSRVRPSQSPDAGLFFQGHGNQSFPSGEVSNVAAIVTPFALEYGRENPWIAASAVGLVAYDGAARMKTQGHWASDVVAGALLGAGIGYAMHEREQSLVLSPLPHGVFIGISKRF